MLGLSRRFNVINEKKPSNSGVFDIFRSLPKCDVVVFNWVENTPDRRGGVIQAALVYLLLITRKIHGVRVVWVLHNKLSHTKSNAWLKAILTRALLRHSDVIVTHAREGVDYAESLDSRARGRVHFLHHPVDRFAAEDVPTEAGVIDVLIWGAMHPYKGVLEFLERMSASGEMDRHRVLVWGKFSSDSYYQLCRQYASETVEIRNAFVPEDELAQAQNRARVILFPYSPETVLSSGALMVSLNSRAEIVGPDTGAFRDLADEGCVKTYAGADDLLSVLRRALHTAEGRDLIERRKAFFAENSWSYACDRMSDLIIESLPGRS